MNETNKRLSWRTFGPGILMASAAIGGSHLIASTQAGAIYGWQLAGLIIIANLLKYPFFRFGTDYVYETGESLIAGYAKKSKLYLWIFFAIFLCTTVINAGAVGLVSAIILKFMLPESMAVKPQILAAIVMGISWLLLVIGRYQLLDRLSKVIVIVLAATTVMAVAIAIGKPSVVQPDFTPPSAWTLGAVPFIVALMGWMPAPIEFSAITSLWTSRKISIDHTNHRQGLIDFNVGFISTAVLALFFLALGVLVQYGSGETIAMKGGAYIPQLIKMYTSVIGNWAQLLIAFIAFMCMFGTTITVLDGYGRADAECMRLILGKEELKHPAIVGWTTYATVGGLIIVTLFLGQLGQMLKFAMITAFVSAPIFAWLNYTLVKEKEELSPWLKSLSILGLLFLSGFAIFYLLTLFKVIG